MTKKITFIILAVIFALSISSCKNSKGSEENSESQNQTTEIVDNNNEQVNNNNNNNVVDENDTNTNTDNSNSNKISSPTDGKVHKITSEDFKNNIFDYMTNAQWEYKGTLPCIIDFYADWCGPCKMIAPIMEELAAEYKGQVVFYKIDVDKEQEIASVFGIQSIPSVLYIPANADPQMSVGAMQKEGYIDAINKILLTK